MSAQGRHEPGEHPVLLRLYIVGEAPNSSRAVANLRAICGRLPKGCARVEIVDILDAPLRALEDGVLATPCLRRLSPEPQVTIIGDLSDHEQVLQTLGLARQAGERR